MTSVALAPAARWEPLIRERCTTFTRETLATLTQALAATSEEADLVREAVETMLEHGRLRQRRDLTLVVPTAATEPPAAETADRALAPLVVDGYRLDRVPRVGTTRCAEDAAGGVTPMTRLVERLTDEVAALREDGASARAHHAKLRVDLEMAHDCLALIHEKLVAIKGEPAMQGCPPMFYPEAIHNINAAKLRAEQALARLVPETAGSAAGPVGTVTPLLDEWRIMTQRGAMSRSRFSTREQAEACAAQMDTLYADDGPHRVVQAALLLPSVA